MKVFSALFCLAALASTLPAHANTLTFSLNTNGCSSGCLVNPAGTVSLQQDGTNKVLVTVTLNAADYNFHSSVNNHNSFAFNLSGDPALTSASFSNASTAITFVNAPGKEAGVSSNQNFDYALNVGSGISTLSFDVTSAGLTTASFVTTGTGGSYFATDVSSFGAAGSGTGNFADNGSTPSSTPAITSTPEPSSLVLLGTGLLGISGFVRRRFRS